MMRSVCSIIDLLFPCECPVCLEENTKYPDSICPLCKKELTASLSIKASSTDPLKRIISCSAYEGRVKIILQRLKFCGDINMIKPLEDVLLKATGCLKESTSIDRTIIIPVPLHPCRSRLRGYNQSEIIARSLSRYMDSELRLDILKKIKKTRPQTGLSRPERLKNIAGAFAVKKASAVKGKNILLVDDVTTTGATLSACARELINAGASEVKAFTIAKTM